MFPEKNMIRKTFVFLVVIFCFCEFFIYYFVLSQCKWPELSTNKQSSETPIKSIILADTHLLGPLNGHWLDKLRREWQMNRAFQTALTLFNPELVFLLGDLFDEGYMVNHDQFKEYILRFHRIFHTPGTTKIISIVGNHDVGFHYRMHPFFTDRFEQNFNNTGISLYTFKNVHFVTINSMAMENDYCYFCDKAESELEEISNTLKCFKNSALCTGEIKKRYQYSRPILMQHFPTYRRSDEFCSEHDYENIETFRENWEVLSKNATYLLGKKLNPRLAFSGHSHNYCRIKNLLNIEEYTVASFSWRYRNEPNFLLATFTKDNYSVSVCKMPKESTVLNIYFFTILISIVINIYKYFDIRKTYVKLKN